MGSAMRKRKEKKMFLAKLRMSLDKTRFQEECKKLKEA